MNLNELPAPLKKELDADPEVLHKLSEEFFSGDSGLELRQFSDVGKSLHTYADLLATYHNPDQKSQYDKQIDSLASQIETAAKQPADFDRQQLGETIDELAATHKNRRSSLRFIVSSISQTCSSTYRSNWLLAASTTISTKKLQSTTSSSARKSMASAIPLAMSVTN